MDWLLDCREADHARLMDLTTRIEAVEAQLSKVTGDWVALSDAHGKARPRPGGGTPSAQQSARRQCFPILEYGFGYPRPSQAVATPLFPNLSHANSPGGGR